MADATLKTQLGESARVEEVKWTALMEVELVGPTDVFSITPGTPKRQPLLQPFTEWLWKVTPLQSGTHELDLRVYALMQIPGSEPQLKHLQVKEARVDVRIAPLWIAGRLVAQKFQWLWGVAIAPIVGWLWSVRKRRLKPAPPSQKDVD